MTAHEPRVREVVGRRVPAAALNNGDFTYVVIEPALGHGDRRRERRLRTRLREGVVAERRGRVVVDCRIRDITRGGARLLLDGDQPLPRTFLLTEAGSRRSFWATLVWQTGRDAGVRLVPSD